MREKSETAEITRSLLCGYREEVVYAWRFLTWQMFPLYPTALFAIITLLFLVVRGQEVFSLVCWAGLVWVLVDYALPFLNRFLSEGREWNLEKQALLDEAVAYIASTVDSVIFLFYLLLYLKNNKNHMYYGAVISLLFVGGWIGSVVNNLLLTYLFVLLMVMLPGLSKHKFIDGMLMAVGSVWTFYFPLQKKTK